jgi:hypothetical protein
MTEFLPTKMSDQARMNKFRQTFTKEVKNLEETRDNITSNKKTSHYYKMDSNLVAQNLETEQLLSQCDQKVKNYQFLDNHLTIQANNLQRIQDIALEAKKIAARAMNFVGKGGLNLHENISGLLSALESELSGTSFGLGLWNGSRDSGEATTSSLTEGPAAQHGANYYLGDSSNHVLYIGGQKREYGYNAAETTIVTLIEGLKELRDSQVGDLIKKRDSYTTINTPYSVASATLKLDQAIEGLSDYRLKLDIIHEEVVKAKEATEDLQIELNNLYNNINGISSEELPQYLLDLQLQQQQLTYLIPFMKRSIEDFSILKYL